MLIYTQIEQIDGGHKMKKYILNLIPFIITVISIISYNIIGSEVLPDGTLSETFLFNTNSMVIFLNWHCSKHIVIYKK